MVWLLIVGMLGKNGMPHCRKSRRLEVVINADDLSASGQASLRSRDPRVVSEALPRSAVESHRNVARREYGSRGNRRRSSASPDNVRSA